MKPLFSGVLLAAIFTIAFPSQSHALSCLQFDDSVKFHLENNSATVFIGKPVQQKDYTNTNGQLIEVSKVLAGSANTKEWVYFNFDKDWGYGCNATPSTLNTTWVYFAVRDNPDEQYLALYRVAVDSDEHDAMEEAIADALEDEKIGEPYLGTSPAVERKAMLMDQIKSLIQEIVILFDQFKYWSAQK